MFLSCEPAHRAARHRHLPARHHGLQLGRSADPVPAQGLVPGAPSHKIKAAPLGRLAVTRNWLVTRVGWCFCVCVCVCFNLRTCVCVCVAQRTSTAWSKTRLIFFSRRWRGSVRPGQPEPGGLATDPAFHQLPTCSGCFKAHCSHVS